MNKIAITGCSGALGSSLSKALLSSGNQVCGLDIIPPPEEIIRHPGFEFKPTDVTDFRAVCRNIAGNQAAIHSAVLLPQKCYLGLEHYMDVNANGAVNFLKACLENNIKKAVLISTSGVLKPKKKGIIFDSDEYRQSSSLYLRSKIEAERMVDALGLKDKIDYLTLRPTSIYGPGMNYKWRDIFHLAGKGRLFVVGSGKQPYSIIHLQDLIEAIILSISKLEKGISGEKILITSKEKLSIYYILAFISKYFSSRLPKKMPFFVAFMGAIVLNKLGKISRNEFLSSIHPENIRDYNTGLFFDNKKANSLLGFESKIDFEPGMLEVLDKYHEKTKK
ncbi:MAG: NAD(P)-dependent oxidoreductase [Candidatus Omnitrophota bacterium]